MSFALLRRVVALVVATFALVPAALGAPFATDSSIAGTWHVAVNDTTTSPVSSLHGYDGTSSRAIRAPLFAERPFLPSVVHALRRSARQELRPSTRFVVAAKAVGDRDFEELLDTLAAIRAAG